MPSLSYAQKSVPYSIIIQIGDFIIGAELLPKLKSNAVLVGIAAIEGLFMDLTHIVDCAKVSFCFMRCRKLLRGIGLSNFKFQVSA